MFAEGSMLCPFLEDHKEDILCGPVWLASGLDLSGHAGMLSLTSPKLVKGNSHIYLFLSTQSLILDWDFVVGKILSGLIYTLVSVTVLVVLVFLSLQVWQEGSTALSWFTSKQ